MVRAAAVLLVLVGCDGVFGLTELHLPIDAAIDAAPRCTQERFGDGIAGLTVRWNRFHTPPISIATVENNSLVIRLSPNMGNYAWVRTNSRYDLTAGTATVRVESVVGSGDAETFFILRQDDDNFYLLHFSADLLSARVRVAGQYTAEHSIPYDPIAHLYWRIEHAPPFVRFLTSSTGVDWAERHAIDDALLALGLVEIELGGGAYDMGVANPRDSVFDDFELCTN